MKKHQKIIIGNWKMNPVKREQALEIIKGIQVSISKYKDVLVVICPPFIYLPLIADKISQSKAKYSLSLGAQNLFPEPKGSYTGETSGELLTQFGVRYVIVGHSERRKMGETNEDVNKKVLGALKAKITPIICIGESARDEDGQYLSFMRLQIEQALINVPKNSLSKLIIAYEPVWAIGATEAMNPHQIHEMTIFIKKTIVDLYKLKTVSMTILYGGSVDPLNAEEILKNGEVDGLLIGRQSLEPENFNQILAITQAL